MKSFIHKLSITIIPLITLSLLATITLSASKMAARYQASALGKSEAVLQIPPSNYTDVLNGLFTPSGR